jgi:hypothetical protein
LTYSYWQNSFFWVSFDKIKRKPFQWCGNPVKKKKEEEEKQEKLAEAEKKKLKALHPMKCPKWGMELIEIDDKAIKVDKCSGCEGMGLAAG